MVEREKLAANNPDVLDYKVELANALSNMGALLLDIGKAEEAIKYFERTQAILKDILAKEPRHTFSLDMRYRSHMGKARALAVLKSADAIGEYDRVVELASQQGKRQMYAERATAMISIGRVAEGLKAIETLLADKSTNAMEWYNHGCAFAQACVVEPGMKEMHGKRAVECLRKAADLGFGDASHWKLDKDLNPLRDREDFKELLAELEKKQNKK